MIDKSVMTKQIKQLHIDLAPGDIAKYVLLPGDPARCDRAAKHLDNPYLAANNREHRTINGSYKGMPVSVTSTGMGCPSAAIAMEELIKCGATTFIRIGSSAALEPKAKIGDILISIGAMKSEGTSKFYVPESFPAIPDFELTSVLIRKAKEMCEDASHNVFIGIGCTDDAFYGETPEYIESLIKLNIQNIEMEASGLFTVAHMRKVRCAAIYGASVNLQTGENTYGQANPKLEVAWDKEIDIALETMLEFYRQNER